MFLYSPREKLSFPAVLKYIRATIIAEIKQVILKAMAEFFVAIKLSVTLNKRIKVKAKRTICSMSSVNPQLK